jgi:hypothetical protein
MSADDGTRCVAKTPREPCKKGVPEPQSGRTIALVRAVFLMKLKGLQIGIDVALAPDGIVSENVPRPPARS